MSRLVLSVALGAFVLCGSSVARGEAAAPTAPSDPAPAEATPLARASMPDVELVNQDGRTVRFGADVIGDRLVAVQFIFTRDKTLSPPMGAVFAALGKLLPADARLVSVSIDPVTDTPERLARWSGNFGSEADWQLLTGDKAKVDGLLKELGVFTPLIEEHAPVVLLGDGASGVWQRANGLAPAAQLADALLSLRPTPSPPEPGEEEETHAYFPNVPLVDQRGETKRLYADLMKDRTVVISAFFTTCSAVCPPSTANLQAIQEALGDRVGKDVHILSITLDPATDTPQRLAEYAAGKGARSGWSFLTGARQDVQAGLGKSGLWVDDKDTHTGILIVGNLRTGLWKKVHALGPAEEVISIVRSVADDQGAP